LQSAHGSPLDAARRAHELRAIDVLRPAIVSHRPGRGGDRRTSNADCAATSVQSGRSRSWVWLGTRAYGLVRDLRTRLWLVVWTHDACRTAVQSLKPTAMAGLQPWGFAACRRSTADLFGDRFPTDLLVSCLPTLPSSLTQTDHSLSTRLQQQQQRCRSPLHLKPIDFLAEAMADEAAVVAMACNEYSHVLALAIISDDSARLRGSRLRTK
jgi:hypothetical protein